MKCPKCGADNPEGAEYCSLCLEKLQGPATGAYPSYQPDRAPVPGTYVAPGEWRGDAEALRPTVSKVVEEKVKKFRGKLIIYGFILAVVVAWLVVSFTVFGNPSPGETSMQMIEAINARDLERFSELILPGNRGEGERLYKETVYYLGENGRYANLRLDVAQDDNYDARSYVEGGSIELGGSTPAMTLRRSDNLVIILENHKGKWYVNPRATDLIP